MMPNFQNVPGGHTISNTTVTVSGGTLTVGLNLQDAAGRDLAVTNAGNDIAIIPGDTRGGVQLYTLRVSPSVLATKTSLTDTIMATDDLSKPPADQFNVLFRFAMQPAHEPVVRDVTKEIFGVDKFTFLTGGELGPFISQPGLGAKIVTSILIQADAAAALREVNLVTFSSGIHDANTFIASGGRGLKFNLMVNQDPTGGANIGGPARKQYLS